jgi:hemerythrin-like metal-binding protein
MMDYTHDHFAHESALMESLRYPELAKHKEQHERFVKRLLALGEACRAGEAQAGHDLLNLLGNWWTTHIRSFDTRLAEFIRRRSKAA